MAIDPEWAALPFDEAIEFFRDKLNIDTASYADMLGAEQAKAFTTAGSVYADVLVDMRDAVDKAIADGESVQDFRKRFADIAESKGWSYFGTEAWRSSLIYIQNMRSSYAAGRWEQMQALKDVRPYLMYRHSGKPPGQRREQHFAWDGLTLPADDPWWLSHYPPNGFRCG